MAEILGIIGSCVAIGQLVGYGSKFARELRQFSECAGSPTVQLQRRASQAALFCSSISTAKVALNCHCTQHRDSAVLKYVSRNRIFKRIETEAAFVRSQLSNAIKRLGTLSRSRSTVIRFPRWRQYRDSILLPFPEMDLVQTYLQMVMSSAQLEACSLQRKKLPPDAEEERKRLRTKIKFLKTVIKDQYRTIERLKAQLEETRRYQHPEMRSRVISTAEGFEALIGLGASIVKTGGVPRAHRVSLSSSASSRETTTRRRKSRSHSTTPDNIQSKKYSDRDSPYSKVLRVDSGMTTESVSGYVTSSDGTTKYVTAVVMENLEGNIISIGEASRLGLIDEPLTGDEAVKVALGSAEPKRVTRKVMLVWERNKGEAAPRRAVTFECCVVESCSPALVFGKACWDASLETWPRSKA